MVTRVQQKRGVKLPPGVKSVARPSRWGNPYKVGDPIVGGMGDGQPLDLVTVIDWYRWHADGKLILDREWLAPLRGATGLACYCPLEDDNGDPQLCHADVLIELLEASGW